MAAAALLTLVSRFTVPGSAARTQSADIFNIVLETRTTPTLLGKDRTPE
jgi:hypothetical protein